MARSFTALLILPTCSLMLSSAAPGQNLVIDPGFEDTLKCPTTIGRFYHPTNVNERYIADWRATTLASPDLHNLCGFNGYQPRNGDGYAGIILYDPTEYREYITALLDTTLEQGVCYYVEFWVALNSGSMLAVDQVQVHFSFGVPLDMTFPPPGPLALAPHFQAASAPTQSTYQRVSGFYTATGGENAMTFGNFMNNANTDLVAVSSVGQVQSYYYIDDVTVTKLDLGPDVMICAGDSATILPNIQNPDLSYAWSDGSSGMTNATAQSGMLSLTISGNGSCSASDAVNIVVDPCLGVQEASADPLTVSWLGQIGAGFHTFRSTGQRDASFTTVIDPTGRRVRAPTQWHGDQLIADMSGQPAGIYLLVDGSTAGTIIVRFVNRPAD